MTGPCRVLIADDHPIVRRGLREVLERAGVEVVAECADGAEALRAAEEAGPEVAVLDLDMPERDGLSVAREIRGRGLPTAVVLLTMHGKEDLLRGALEAGALGYVVKDGPIGELVEAIRAAREGRTYISSALSAALLAPAGRPAPEPDPAALDALTPTERRVLRLVAECRTSKEIAGILGIHYRTVENHRTSISGKLGISGSHALTRFALRHRDRLLSG